MHCPHCGASIENNADICPLCGTSIDKDSVFTGFMRKGDEFFSNSDYDKALVYYNKALEAAKPTSPEIYIKLGNTLDKKNDRQAAGMYLKALSFDFYNEHIHTLLMAFYDKYNRLKDLKAWYDKSRASADGVFIDKKIETINSIVSFKEKSAEVFAQQASEFKDAKSRRFANSMINGFKQYMMMNVIMGIILLVIGIGGIAAVYFGANVMMVFAAAGVFFVISLGVVMFIRTKKMNDKKASAGKMEDIMKDFKK